MEVSDDGFYDEVYEGQTHNQGSEYETYLGPYGKGSALFNIIHFVSIIEPQKICMNQLRLQNHLEQKWKFLLSISKQTGMLR